MNNKVIISVDSGLPEVINLPPGVGLVIYDYDIEGCDPESLDLDENGRSCIIGQYVGVEHEDG
jgi:hypothetical protein